MGGQMGYFHAGVIINSFGTHELIPSGSITAGITAPWGINVFNCGGWCQSCF